MNKTMPDEDRFWLSVQKRGQADCWLWTGAKMKNGYGTLGIGSRLDGSNRNVLAHRYACELTYPLFPGWQALHKCDVKNCVNPAHLYVGTHRDNMRDAAERHRMRSSTERGAKNPNAKLSHDEAVQVKTAKASLSVLADLYGITKTQVSHIKSGKSWGHLNVA